MARESNKNPEELEVLRKEREEAIEEKASLGVTDIFDESVEMGKREKSRRYNKWYKAVRKGSVVVNAKKLSKNYNIDEVLDEAKILTAKLYQLLELNATEYEE